MCYCATILSRDCDCTLSEPLDWSLALQVRRSSRVPVQPQLQARLVRAGPDVYGCDIKSSSLHALLLLRSNAVLLEEHFHRISRA